MSYIERLRLDLKRPFGGWTVGALTLLLALAGPLVGLATVEWVGIGWMFGFLFVHMLWGSAGYYPADMFGRGL